MDLSGARGATLALPAQPLVLLQVAALLWHPASRARTFSDPRLSAALTALWYDHGVESQQHHPMDLDMLRHWAEQEDGAAAKAPVRASSGEAHNPPDRGLV